MDMLIKIALAIGSGLLIGFEREISQEKNRKLFAGARTYPLISLWGFLSAMFSAYYYSWAFGVSFGGLLLLLAISYYKLAEAGRVGATNEVAVALSFIFGAMFFLGQETLAVACTIITTILISLKIQIKEAMGKINQSEIYALLKFLIMLGIVLPILPANSFGPFNALNPRQIWSMVILISGISFGGYLLVKFFGSNKGIYWTAILGGVASSTAISWDFSHKSASHTDLSKPYALGIVIASSIMFIRVLVLIFALNAELASKLIIPLCIMGLCGIFFAYISFKVNAKTKTNEQTTFANPLNLNAALKFALIFSGIQLLVKAADYYFGANGVYLASAISGLTDVDAIVISMCNRGTQANQLLVSQNSVLIAVIANSLVKFGIGIGVGSKEMRKTVILGFGAILLGGAAYMAINNMYYAK